MQLLTLPEIRQLEKLRADVNKIDSYNPVMPLFINETSRDFWLNIFDMALAQNEAIKKIGMVPDKKVRKDGEWKQIMKTLHQKISD